MATASERAGGSKYLLLYNVILAAGWGLILFKTLSTVLLGGTSADVWKAVENDLKWFQSAAVLEVAHSALGLVRSPVATTAVQVASRLWILWGVINLVPDATTTGRVQLAQLGSLSVHLNLVTLLIAWGVCEVIRYSYYATKEVGMTPPWLLWLRYTAFIPLYPFGVASELAMVWLALPHIKKDQLWSLSLPNEFNFAFDYHLCCIIAMITYLPGLPVLYAYMLKQRAKFLGSPEKVKSA